MNNGLQWVNQPLSIKTCTCGGGTLQQTTLGWQVKPHAFGCTFFNYTLCPQIPDCKRCAQPYAEHKWLDGVGNVCPGHSPPIYEVP